MQNEDSLDAVSKAAVGALAQALSGTLQEGAQNAVDEALESMESGLGDTSRRLEAAADRMSGLLEGAAEKTDQQVRASLSHFEQQAPLHIAQEIAKSVQGAISDVSLRQAELVASLERHDKAQESVISNHAAKTAQEHEQLRSAIGHASDRLEQVVEGLEEEHTKNDVRAERHHRAFAGLEELAKQSVSGTGQLQTSVKVALASLAELTGTVDSVRTLETEEWKKCAERDSGSREDLQRRLDRVEGAQRDVLISLENLSRQLASLGASTSTAATTLDGSLKGVQAGLQKAQTHVGAIEMKNTELAGGLVRLRRLNWTTLVLIGLSFFAQALMLVFLRH